MGALHFVEYRRQIFPISKMTEAAAVKPAKAKKPAKKAEHPPSGVMVLAAVKALKEAKGSSLPAIKKYIAANYKVDIVKISPFIKKAKKASEPKKKAVKKVKKTAAKKTPKKAKKPAAKKSPKKAAAKKPAAKKVAKKSPKKAAKKAAPKKK